MTSSSLSQCNYLRIYCFVMLHNCVGQDGWQESRHGEDDGEPEQADAGQASDDHGATEDDAMEEVAVEAEEPPPADASGGETARGSGGGDEVEPPWKSGVTQLGTRGGKKHKRRRKKLPKRSRGRLSCDHLT